MRYQVLYPPGEGATADDLCAAMAPWERGHDDRPHVLCNMVSSLDGLTQLDGGSTGLGGEGDHAMFHGLRGVVDGVLAGTGTFGAERYGRLVRRPERRALRRALGLEEDPWMLTITRSGTVPWDAPLFDVPEQRVAIAGDVEVPAHVRAQVEVVDGGDGPADALRSFRGLGVRSVLCEGGPGLNRSLVADGLLDELFMTVSPRLVGGDGLRVLDGDRLPEPLEMSPVWVLRAGDELLLRFATR